MKKYGNIIHNIDFFENGISNKFRNNNFRRTLSDNAKEHEYVTDKGKIKSQLHWGQRKLYFSEVEFLTKFGNKNDLCVYAGGAPGTHIDHLSKMFPDRKFVLVDPRPFDPILKKNKKITTKQEYFTNEMAKEYKDRKDVVFISDIRVDPEEEQVNKDMIMQQEWVELMNPKYSMLKFRLPWCENKKDIKMKYFDGKVFLPVFGPQSTTETRLVVKGSDKFKMWDACQYERQMYYFNHVTRKNYYEHDVKDPNLCHCFDCMSEIHILKMYLKKYKKDDDIAKLSSIISKKLTKGKYDLNGYYYNKYPKMRKNRKYYLKKLFNFLRKTSKASGFKNKP